MDKKPALKEMLLAGIDELGFERQLDPTVVDLVKRKIDWVYEQFDSVVSAQAEESGARVRLPLDFTPEAYEKFKRLQRRLRLRTGAQLIQIALAHLESHLDPRSRNPEGSVH